MKMIYQNEKKMRWNVGEKIREEQQIHMQLLKEEEDRLQKLEDDRRAKRKLRSEYHCCQF